MNHSLSVIASITNEIAQAHNAQQAMQIVVNRIRNLFNVSVCSLYLFNSNSQRLEMVATDGLSQSAIGTVSLGIDEGVVGLIGRSMHPVNIANASQHEDFIYIPETQEEPFSQFMGAPLIHLRQLVGVLVIQGTDEQRFSTDGEALMVTISAQLAGTLATLQQSEQWHHQPGEHSIRYKGIKAASGIGVGRVVPIGLQDNLATLEQEQASSLEEEQEDFRQATKAVDEELTDAADRMALEGNHEISSLLQIYQMMLNGSELQQGVQQGILAGQSASWALHECIETLAAAFEAADDPYLNARQEDIRNIGNRLLQHLQRKGKTNELAGDDPLILAGKQISITDLASLPVERIRGLICTGGSALSHTAIVAKSLGIAAVMGVESFDPSRCSDSTVIVDGYRGECIKHPSTPLLDEYLRLQNAEQQLNKDLCVLKDKPAVTTDGTAVRLMANTGLLADVSPGLASGAEGIGLYRSEMPFMQHSNFPTEDEQYAIYHQVLEAYAPRPVYMRILDIGGDKQLPYFEINEENPYLGWRGIRLMLDNTSLLVSQLRAMMRAAEGLDNLQILAPMVARIEEMEMFRLIANRVYDELLEDGFNISQPKIGMMLEVPSVLFLLPELAPLLDFISIGSNDLTQYLLAVDRNNPKVASVFDNLDPAVLRALHSIAQSCQQHQLELSLCGEMASDPAAALLLVGMGFTQLSLAAHQIPKIKWLVRHVSQAQAQQLLEEAMQLPSAQQIRQHTDCYLAEHNLSLISNPGTPDAIS